jgi:undecaprenyl-diphosphatase
VVFHPQLVGPDTREALRTVLAAHGHHRPRFVATTADDPGHGAAAQAVRERAALVVACGGDGTVTACAHALAGSGTALAVVPCGTGNVLARNLRLPNDPVRALRTALAVRPRRIDLASAEGDGIGPACVCAMAGIGLDAAIVAGTGRGLKRRLGWVAYLLPVLRHLRDRRIAITVTLDDEPALRRRVQMAVVGNVGSLQAGVRLLPDAEPDDGLLDLVLLHPQGIGGWTAAVLGLVTGRPGTRVADPRGPLEYFRARRITLTTDDSAPRELDGEAVAAGRTLTLQVRPAALLVHAPGGVRRHPGAQETRPQMRERTQETGTAQARTYGPPDAPSVPGAQPAAPPVGRGI